MTEKEKEYQELFSNADFIREYSKLTAEKLSAAQKSLEKSAPKVLSQSSFPLKGKLIKYRRFGFILTSIIITLSTAATIINFSVILDFVLSASSILCGIVLAILLFAEIVGAAGVIKQQQVEKGDLYERKFSFSYSISRISELLKILFVSFLSLALGFANIYSSLSNYALTSFSESINYLDSIYFSIVTFATVGFGDITPKSDLAKFIVTAEIFTSFFFISIFLTTTISWVIGTEKSRVEAYLKREEDKMQETENIIKTANLGVYGDIDELIDEVKSRMKKNSS